MRLGVRAHIAALVTLLLLISVGCGTGSAASDAEVALASTARMAIDAESTEVQVPGLQWLLKPR